MESQKPKKGYLINDLTKNVHPTPIVEDESYEGSNMLQGKHALIIGGDSGIGRAVAILFAKEGAEITFTYTSNESLDAFETTNTLRKYTIANSIEVDIGNEEDVRYLVSNIRDIDILIYNPAEQHYVKNVDNIEATQLHRVFQTNVFGAFYFLYYGLSKIKDEGSIVFTTSVTAFEGSKTLIDYASSKGALTSLMYSLSQSDELLARSIRVNAVAPGPVWTPLIPATIPDTEEEWGNDTTVEDTAHPIDIAYTYLYLVSNKQKFVTGQTIHVNGKRVS